MTEITSLQNQKLKALRRLHTRRGRAAAGRFLAEGEDLLDAAAEAGATPLEGYRASGSALGGEGFLDVAPELLAKVSSLGSGTRVIGVYEQRWGGPVGPLCVYLHGIRDPGNVGAVLRSARAFGAGCVVLGPGCADPHSPKAVRASMGAIFHIALARVAAPGELPGKRIALEADAPCTLRGPLAAHGGEATLLVGAERDGLPEDLASACELRAGIPIAGDSLNAAMAATVALYEMAREAPAGERGGA
jgi:TrmH family RNA methyltransferase